jgi:ABC transport system ATP-binding/permease protein
MAVLLTVSGLARSYEGRTLFRDLSFGLSDTDRLGVVGANGSGKSTLLRVLAGEVEADAGTITFASGTRVSYLAQNPALDPAQTVLHLASGTGAAEHEAKAILDRLGFADPGVRVGELSGGQRRRAALARALARPSDLLILDEPTNHLDADTVEWLEGELRRRRGALLLVTHDRYLLEHLTNRMVELDRGGSFWHDGSYSDLLEAKAIRGAAASAAEQRRRNLARTELAWLRRGAQARSSKPKFRLQQAAALLADTPAREAGPLQLGTGRRRLGRDVLELQGVGLSFGDRTVLRDVDLLVGPGDRVGIVGPNGAGKTTLLRVLTGGLVPTSGTVRRGSTVEIGWYEQEPTDPAIRNPTERRVIDAIVEIAREIPLADGSAISATTLAGRFGFDARLQSASVPLLSGGERRRLELLRALMAAPNVLVLDEPTNDLDLDTLAALEDHLDGFSGTLLVASHDRYVLDRLCDVFYGIGPDGTVRQYPGDWATYRELSVAAAARPARPASRPGDRRPARAPRAPTAGKALRELETRMDRLSQRRDELVAALDGVDFQEAARIGRELEEVVDELRAVEDRWLDLADR